MKNLTSKITCSCFDLVNLTKKDTENQDQCEKA
jgi:hypothetical protein